MVGIKLSPLNNQIQKEPKGPSKAIYHSFKEVWFVTTTSLKYLGKIITGSGDSSQLGGPIRIAKITGQVAEHGIIPWINSTVIPGRWRRTRNLKLNSWLLSLFPR